MSENRNTSPDRVAYFDIVERLRSLRLLHVPIVAEYADEAADEIERLRNSAVDTRETVCPHVRGTVTQHCSLNLTITDEEREAISLAYSRLTADANYTSIAATMKALLERTNHDAVPEAKATNDGGTPKDAVGTGNTQNDASPEAGRPSVGAEDERVRASVQSTGNTQEPVAWAILHLDQQYVSLLREMAEAHNVFAAPIVPLYRSPTLTAEERHAIEWGIACVTRDTHARTLRLLLERMK